MPTAGNLLRSSSADSRVTTQHCLQQPLKGQILKEGTIGDATIIAAPSSTKNQRGEREPEMHQTKKGKQIEKLKASMRAKVEHPFHIVKNIFCMKKVRYRGLFKNTAQLFTLFGLAHLLNARRRLFEINAQGAS
jgi:hypothetical protein